MKKADFEEMRDISKLIAGGEGVSDEQAARLDDLQSALKAEQCIDALREQLAHHELAAENNPDQRRYHQRKIARARSNLDQLVTQKNSRE